MTKLQEERGYTFTRAILLAEREQDLDQQISQYYERYHPMGYNTKLISPKREIRPGVWEARMWRYSSCD